MRILIRVVFSMLLLFPRRKSGILLVHSEILGVTFSSFCVLNNKTSRGSLIKKRFLYSLKYFWSPHPISLRSIETNFGPSPPSIFPSEKSGHHLWMYRKYVIRINLIAIEISLSQLLVEIFYKLKTPNNILCWIIIVHFLS